jgi:8-oxo-dGTP diphosphatase
MTKNPQKILHGRYHVVPRTLILIFKDDRVLLQKGSQTKKLWAGLYNGLGGHIERGEDVLSSARRELLEEAGLTCADLRICGMVMIDVNEDEGILMFVLSGMNPAGEIRASDEGVPEWIPISKVKQLPVVDDIPSMIERVKRHQGNIPFSGYYTYGPDGKRIEVFN